MENRDRDKLSHNDSPTAAGDINRETEQRRGSENDESTADFGQQIGRSENLEEPNQRNRDIETDRSGDSKGRH